MNGPWAAKEASRIVLLAARLHWDNKFDNDDITAVLAAVKAEIPDAIESFKRDGLVEQTGDDKYQFNTLRNWP